MNGFIKNRNNRTRSAILPTSGRIWERPFTAKRYLHPPYTENMMTMWPDFKVICGDITEGKEEINYISSAFRLLKGNDATEIPFEKTIYHVREDGIPIHTISYEFENFTLEMESFCNFDRICTSFTKVTVKNVLKQSEKNCICVIPRTGKENLLTGMIVDGYSHFNSNIANFGFIPSNWKYSGNCISDGEYNILLKTEGFETEWQGHAEGLLWHQRHLLKLHFILEENESKSFYIGFRHGEVAPYNYDIEKNISESFWKKELDKVHTFVSRQELIPVQKNLVSQLLQMFSYPVGKNYILPRQGGLHRSSWPVEAIEFLIALDRLGNFFDYTEKTYNTFFDILQIKEGEDAGLILNLNGQKWASNTGGSVLGISRHLIYRNDKSTFFKYREAMLLAFTWMEKQREKTKNNKYFGYGIFPPMAATDWPGEFQSWCWTDANNLMGYEWMCKVFNHFNDIKTEEIKTAYNDYMSCMQKVLENEISKNTNLEELNLTNKLGQEPTDPPTGPVGDSATNLLRAKVIKAGSETAKLVENYLRNRGYGQNGLMGLMNDGLLQHNYNSDCWAGHTWYTNAPDICWFNNWLESAERNKALECLNGQLTFSMTPEFYMCERYADNDPYFTPWLPNASANGRTLMMILDFYN